MPRQYQQRGVAQLTENSRSALSLGLAPDDPRSMRSAKPDRPGDTAAGSSLCSVDYVAYPEMTLVRSNVVSGSMAGSHVPKLVAMHAVPRDDIGKMTRTACGRDCRISPEDVDPQSWDQVNPSLKCKGCDYAIRYGARAT